MLFMWWVMMIAMMLPSAAPVILLYARVVGQVPGAVTPTMAFAAGYLVCWLGFSVLATALQFALERSGVVDGMMMWSTERWLTVGLLVSAGLYQLSPLKTACLAQCRSPAEFLTRHRRPGRLGAFHMGLVHGAYCLGCCWALMLLLFAAGIMNLVWIAGLSIVVLLEKLAPFGAALTKPLAVLFLLAAAAVAAPALARVLQPPMAVGATRVAPAAAGAPAVTVAAPGTPSPAIKQGGRFQPAGRRHGAGVGDFATAAARSSPT
jgi:predicted metal-binding membrane protein